VAEAGEINAGSIYLFVSPFGKIFDQTEFERKGLAYHD
jgi:hypothetical protein